MAGRGLGSLYAGLEIDTRGLKAADKATKQFARSAEKQFKKAAGTARVEFAKSAKAAALAAKTAEKASKDASRVAIAKSRDSTKVIIESMRATERAAKDTAKAKIAATRRAEKAAEKAAKATARDYKEASRVALASAKAQARGQIAAAKATSVAAKKAARVSAQAARKAERASNRWRVSLLAVGFASLLVIRRSIKMADTYNILQQRIKAATLATGDYAEVSKELSAIAHRTGTELLGNVALFQTLARTAPELDSTNNAMLQLTETLGQLGVIGGSSTIQMRNGLLQFSQAMAGGIFRAEEMNGIIENIPEVAARIATGMDMTVGALRLATLEGKVLSKDVFDALMKQSGTIAEQFGKMPEVIARSTVKLSNSVEQFLGRLDKAKGLTTSLADGITGLATMLNKADVNAFASGLERVAFYLVAIAAVRMGVAIASLWAMTAAVTATGKVLALSKWPALVALLAEAALFLKNNETINDFVDTEQLDLAVKKLEDLEKLKEKGRRKGFAGAGFDKLYGGGKLDRLIDRARAQVRVHKQVIEDVKRARKDEAIAATISKGYDSGVKFDESHGNRFRSNSIANAKKHAKEQQNIVDNAAADKLEAAQKVAKAERASLKSSIQSLATSLMTERELITHNYKEKQKIVDKAEKAGITALIPYSEQRIRLQRQEWEAIADLLKKKNQGLRDGLAALDQSLMSEKQLRKQVYRADKATLDKALNDGFISEKEHGYKLGKLRAELAVANDKETADKATSAREGTGIDALIERYATEETIVNDAHFKRLSSLAEALSLQQITQAEFNALELAAKQEHVDALAAIDNEHLKGYSTLKTLFGAIGLRLTKANATDEEKANEKAFTKQLSLAEGNSRELFNIQKGLNVAQALIDAPAAILSSFKHGSSIGGAPLGFVFAGLAAAATATHVAAIQSASYGGGRLYGGSVSPNTAYSVNENKRPELLTVGGKDMLMMGSQGGKVTPNNKLGGSSDLKIKLNVVNMEGQRTKVTGQRETSDGFELDIMTELIDQTVADGIIEGNSRTVAAMGQKFGGNSAYGNY